MPPVPTGAPKPRSRLAGGLVIAGSILFGLERYGLGQFEGKGSQGLHLDSNLLSVLVLAPVALIVAGAVVFVVGRMRRR